MTAGLLVIGTMLTCVGSAASDTRLGAGAVPVRPIARNVPALDNAVAVGTLVAIDPKSEVAEFRIHCGWYAKRGKPTDPQATMPERKLRAGLWKVNLRGVSFNIESYPSGPASGIAHKATLKSWERYVSRSRWTGTLFFAGGWSKPFLSDGPTTDICGGVLG
jgi:hypothetical protein